MGTTITLTTDTDTLTLTGDGVYVGCTYDKLVGWYGVPTTDLGFVKRPAAPGAFSPTQTYPPEATISVEGQYFGSSRADALLMRERLSALYNEGKPVTMTVADDLRTTSRRILVADVNLPWTIHQQFKFTLDAKADDPRRYGTAVTVGTTLAQAGGGLDYQGSGGLDYQGSGGLDYGVPGSDGRTQVANPGNAATVSSYVISGGSMTGGFALVNVATGERLTYIGDVAAGTTVTLDTRTQTAFINGTGPGGRFLTNPAWWSVPKGSTLSIQFVALGVVTGNPRVDITTPPAFY